MTQATAPAADEEVPTARPGPQGSQTLLRGFDMLDQLIDGPVTLAGLSGRIGLTRSTTHHLANALTDRGFLTFQPRAGYQLGPKLLHLGFLAQAQVDLVDTARPHIEALATRSGDSVHLGRLDEDRALYLDTVSGRRRVEIASRVGDRRPLTSTGLGRALMRDGRAADWARAFEREQPGAAFAPWQDRVRGYAEAGRAYDLEEDEDQVRCVAAPIRDASGGIVAAISVSDAARDMDDAPMAALGDDVRDTARAIGGDLGWQEGDR